SRPAAPSLRPDDVFIAVKTTRKNHGPRLRLLLHTWISQARRQTFIFTDGDDPELELQGGECPPAPAPAGPGPRDPGAAATALLWVPLSVEAPEARGGPRRCPGHTACGGPALPAKLCSPPVSHTGCFPGRRASATSPEGAPAGNPPFQARSGRPASVLFPFKRSQLMAACFSLGGTSRVSA
ncbi:PREDICTED: uncharacterized protein LOC108530416, partial [Rhinopithecus bieti]|uniref:uncharacterized protein LOC108530416 n=1 Tax=Rhinopithecus bieti TaxID=61621 RepID=UPI00083C4E06